MPGSVRKRREHCCPKSLVCLEVCGKRDWRAPRAGATSREVPSRQRSRCGWTDGARGSFPKSPCLALLSRPLRWPGSASQTLLDAGGGQVPKGGCRDGAQGDPGHFQGQSPKDTSDSAPGGQVAVAAGLCAGPLCAEGRAEERGDT